MAVIGVGVDVMEIARFAEALARRPRIAERCFTEAEAAYCADAARFAAKEAVGKALGIGMTRWREVEVIRGRGAPTIALHGRYAERGRQLGVTRIHVSLTHGEQSAIAFAVAESAAA
jgi:holo-[acyl-carrier protein] synthase